MSDAMTFLLLMFHSLWVNVLFQRYRNVALKYAKYLKFSCIEAYNQVIKQLAFKFCLFNQYPSVFVSLFVGNNFRNPREFTFQIILQVGDLKRCLNDVRKSNRFLFLGLFFICFRPFKQTFLFLQQLNVKNVHPVYGAGIRTHSLQNMSLVVK